MDRKNYQCPNCETIMPLVMKPDSTGICAFCFYLIQKNRSMKKIKLKRVCKNCGGIKDYVYYKKRYCNRCGAYKGKCKNV